MSDELELGTEENPEATIEIDSGELVIRDSNDNIVARRDESAGTWVLDSVSTGSTKSNINEGQYQASIDGLIVPVADGLGVGDAIDPAEHDRPLHTAKELVKPTSRRGAVLLPPTSFSEADEIIWPQNIDLRGWGMASSAIDFTNQSADGLVFDDSNTAATKCYFTGFQLSGPGAGTGTNVKGVSFRSGQANRMIFDGVTIRDWCGHGIYGSGGEFEIDFRYVVLDGIDAGDVDAVIDHSGGGAPNRYGFIRTYPVDDSSGKDSKILRTENQGTYVDVMNIGGTAEAAAETRYAPLRVGHVNWEPTGQNSTTNHVFKFLRAGPSIVNSVRVTGSSADFDYVYEHGFNAKNVLMGPVQFNNSTANSNVVDISGEPTGPSWYFGPAADIDNSAGTSTGHVRSLGTAGTGNG